jgi:ATP-dependent DNA helicase PIF1
MWRPLTALIRTFDMRVALHGDTSAGNFSRTLLQVGDMTHPVDPATGELTFPKDLGNVVNNLDELVQNVYPKLGHRFKDLNWLCERAILAPKNDIVNTINEHVMKQLPGQVMTYRSVDSALEPDQAVQSQRNS